MKFIDIAKNIDKSEKNECYVDLEALSSELDIYHYSYGEMEQDPVRLKAYWVDNWYSYDSWVGGRIYFFDDEPVAYSFQEGSKLNEEFGWFSQEAAEKVRDFVQGLRKEVLRVHIIDVNEDMGDSYKIDYADDVLDWSMARYHGQPFEMLSLVQKSDWSHEDKVKIRLLDSEWPLVVDMKELDFLFHVDYVGKGVDALLEDASSRVEASGAAEKRAELEL